jgi:KDO2-lipid IV(A) lauroyltransferase
MLSLCENISRLNLYIYQTTYLFTISLASRIAYYIIFGFTWILTLLPLRVLHLFSDFLFLVFYYLLSYRKKITETNLRNSFPEKSSLEIKQITKKFYRRLCDQIIESFKLLHLSKKQLSKRFIYVNPELLEELYQSGRSIILLCGHIGTWEWIMGIRSISKYKFLAVYQPQSFSDFARIYDVIGNRFGIHPVPMKDTFREIMSSKSKNELTATFLLGDQSPRPEGIKFWTNFLNQDTATITGFERIAKKTNQAVVYTDIVWKKRGYYELTFRKICDNPGQIEDYGITEAYFRALEKTIVRRPELWLWTHRRWKHKREQSAE